MSALRLPLEQSRLVDQVVAWHNRHPLARRIDPSRVTGIGVVAIPFVGAGLAPAHAPSEQAGAAPGGSLRERAKSAIQPAQMAADAAHTPPRLRQAAFKESFIAPISSRRAARFARQHGSDRDMSPSAWPRREVRVDGASAVVWRFVLTAAIESEDRRVRVLVGTGQDPVVIGPRLWKPAKFAALVMPLAAATAVGVVTTLNWRPRQEPPAAPLLATVALPLSSIPASAPAVVLPEAIAASTPPAAEPEAAVTTAESVDIRPRLDPDVARAARLESTAMRKSAAKTTVNAAPLALALDSSSAAGNSFALVARSTRSRAASEIILGLMQGAAALDAGSRRTEVLPAAEGFRASWWPFASRGEAERAREKLAAVGLPVDIVEF